MSAGVTPERLRLAKRAVKVIEEHGPIRDTDLLSLLACAPAELRAALGIVIRWRKADRCADYLVAAPSRHEAADESGSTA